MQNVNITKEPLGTFIQIPHALGNKGTARIMFLIGNLAPFVSVGESVKLNSVTYQLLTYKDTSSVCGVVFETQARGTTVNDTSITSVCGSEISEIYTVNYSLEKLGLLIYEGNSFSTLILKRDVRCPLLVEVE